MRIEAPRPILLFAAAGLVLLALALQLIAAAYLGEGALATAEPAAWLLFAVVVQLLLAPLGRGRALLVGALGFILMAWAVHLNARYSTHLDVLFGGAHAWSAQRVAVLTLFVGPALGLIVGGLAAVLARREAIRWRGRTYSS